MTERETLGHEYKMYSIVLRQLDGINNGVQTTHGVCEYVRKHWNDPDLQRWLNHDKTLVVLNGGTYKDMEEIKTLLFESQIPFETFEEEDLGDLTTSICLLADERVWNQKAYPKFEIFRELTNREHGYEVPDEILVMSFEKIVGGHQNGIKKQLLNNMRTI